MTTAFEAPPQNVMEVLRGERATRPLANSSLAAGLRAHLEDAIFAILGPARSSQPVTIHASSLRHDGSFDELSTSSLAQVRGVLIVQLLRLTSIGVDVHDAFDDALLAWRADVGANALTDFVDRLDSEELARLASDVTAHWITLKRSLGPLSGRWWPRTSLRASQRLAGGHVVLRDVVDLMVGSTTAETASVAMLDVTTSPLTEGAERVMRYHALVQTLRTSVAPLRTSMFSTSTGELWSADVNDELLTRSVHDVLGVLRNLAVTS